MNSFDTLIQNRKVRIAAVGVVVAALAAYGIHLSPEVVDSLTRMLDAAVGTGAVVIE